MNLEQKKKLPSSFTSSFDALKVCTVFVFVYICATKLITTFAFASCKRVKVTLPLVFATSSFFFSSKFPTKTSH